MGDSLSGCVLLLRKDGLVGDELLGKSGGQRGYLSLIGGESSPARGTRTTKKVRSTVARLARTEEVELTA